MVYMVGGWPQSGAGLMCQAVGRRNGVGGSNADDTLKGTNSRPAPLNGDLEHTDGNRRSQSTRRDLGTNWTWDFTRCHESRAPAARWWSFGNPRWARHPPSTIDN